MTTHSVYFDIPSSHHYISKRIDVNWQIQNSSLKRFSLLAVLFVLPYFGLCLSPVKGEDEIGVARFVLAGHVDGRLKLKSGSFSAIGTLEERAPDWGELRGAVEVFCAFDFPEGKLRFDRNEPARGNSDPDAAVVGPRDWVQVEQGGQFARTSDAVTVRPGSHNIISVLPSSRKAPSWVRPFDVRALGTAHKHDVDAGTPFTTIVDVYQRQAIDTVVEHPEGMFRIDWVVYSPQSARQAFNRSVWFDAKKDYAAVKMEFRVFRGFEPQESENSPKHIRWSEVRERQDIQMTRVKDVWVPDHVTLTSSGGQKTEVLKFSWIAVNEPISDALFGADGFPMEGVEIVVDSRLGRNIVTKAILPEKNDVPPVASTSRSGWTVEIFVVNCILGVVLVLWSLRRRKLQATPNHE